MEKFKLQYQSKVNTHGLSFKNIGDTVCVKIVETDAAGKALEKKLEGTIIRLTRLNSYANASILLRIFGNVSIERLFYLNSPVINHIKIISCKKARRAKLYYLRDRSGKGTKLKTVNASVKSSR
ncbi:MAG: 50S ribosomal protein L19 [Pseudomonadota bacterium]